MDVKLENVTEFLNPYFDLKMYRFQWMSDLHLEKNPIFPRIIPMAKNLILAGDIGCPKQPVYKEFLNYCNLNFEKVFLIAGNHEYKSSTIPRTNLRIEQIVSKLSNIEFLNDRVYNHHSLKIYGGVMWSYNPSTQTILSSKVAENRNLMLLNYISGLQKVLTNPEVLVISHYLPGFFCIDEKKYFKYKDSYFLYASNLKSELIHHPSIKKWVYGHTHSGTFRGKFLCNPRGDNIDFNPNRIFEI